VKNFFNIRNVKMSSNQLNNHSIKIMKRMSKLDTNVIKEMFIIIKIKGSKYLFLFLNMFKKQI
jgi:hypothetical protein